MEEDEARESREARDGLVDDEGKVYVKLTDTDSNVFALLGRCTRAMKRAGQAEKASALAKAVMEASDYDTALNLMMEACHVE